MATLEDIAARIASLGEAIRAPRGLLPALRPVNGYSATWLEATDDGALVYATAERGNTARRMTRDSDELLFWVFEPVCFEMAMTWECSNRVPAVDFRAVMFARQLYLLGKLEATWPDRFLPHLESVLQMHPYAGEDVAKAVADVERYRAAHGDEIAADEVDALRRIAALRAAGEPPDATDLHELRRLAVYAGLIERGVNRDEARAVAAMTPAGY
jgi:hypothetical protein